MRETFAALVGESWAREPAPPLDDLDGVRPRLVVSPGTAAECAEVLRAAARNRLHVVPVGTGHMLGLGNPPSGADLCLSTERLVNVTEYEPADLTAAAQAGLTLGALNDRLAEHRQILPWDPPGGRGRTLGGVAAVGKVGPLRLGFGQPRDWILGIEVATLEGKLVRAGGRVVKNVAGYDLTKLFVGSLGTLGVITELNVRLRPQPATELTVVVASEEPARLWQLAVKIRQSHAQPVALEVLSAQAMRWAGTSVAEGRSYLCARFAGEDADVRFQAILVESLAKEVGLDISEQIGADHVASFWAGVADLPLCDAVSVALRLSLPPSRLSEATERGQRSLEAVWPEIGFSAGPGVGSLVVLLGAPADQTRLAALVPEIERLRAACRADGGSLVVERAPVGLRRRIDVWGEVGSAEGLMRGMKRLFDPDGRLNPGRFVRGT